MAGFFCAGPCFQPFQEFNEIFGKGVPEEIAGMVSLPEDWKKTKIVKTGIKKATMDHYQKDWLGTNAWFGAESGQKLYRAFVYALQTAGPRGVTGVWVEGLSVRVSVLDHGDALQVVVSSPRPKGGKPHAVGPCGMVHAL